MCQVEASPRSDLPIFEVIERDGRTFRVFADGETEGFEYDALICSRLREFLGAVQGGGKKSDSTETGIGDMRTFATGATRNLDAGRIDPEGFFITAGDGTVLSVHE